MAKSWGEAQSALLHLVESRPSLFHSKQLSDGELQRVLGVCCSLTPTFKPTARRLQAELDAGA